MHDWIVTTRNLFVTIIWLKSFNNLSNHAESIMMRLISKFLFPHLQPDQRRQQMNLLVIISLVTLAVGGTVAVVILLTNRR
jgi:hypothetical protein